MVPTQISCRLFSPTGFFPAGFFWPPSDSSSCVNCRSALSLVLRIILRSCNRLWYNVLLLLLVLGLNCQNKPNGFSSCCVLRVGAEIVDDQGISCFNNVNVLLKCQVAVRLFKYL